MYFKGPTQIFVLTMVTASLGLVALASELPTDMATTSAEVPSIGAGSSDYSMPTIEVFDGLDGDLEYLGPDDPGPEQAPGFHDTSEYMIGSVTVSVILPESDGSHDTETEDWTLKEREKVSNEILDGIVWWMRKAGQHRVPFNHISWVNTYLVNPIATKYEPINRCGGTYKCNTGQNLWIKEIMGKIGYSEWSYFDRVRHYNNDLRNARGTDWAFTIFVVDSSNDKDNKFTNGKFGYAYLGGPFVVMTYGNNGYGIGKMNVVTAHEMGHIFHALDEYAASKCTTTEKGGYLGRTNDNCENGGPGKGNIMNNNKMSGASPRIETREQIGWRDSDGDYIPDILDTYPRTTLNTYSPDPTPDYTPYYTGNAKVVPLTNRNPNGAGNDVSINKISFVQYRVDSGVWLTASASDGSYDEASENFHFTTLSLSPGTHTICARARNDVRNYGSQSCDTLTIDAPPTANAGPDQTVNEGSTVTFNGGGSTDDIGIVSYDWNFGDGSPHKSGVITTHEYGDNGVYMVTLITRDTAGQTDTDTMYVTVLNVAPSVSAGTDKTINEGDTASIGSTFSDPGWRDTHTATINWGEGTTDVGAVSEENIKPDATGTVTGSHTYGDNGVFTVSVTVCDDDSGCVTDTLQVTVNNVAPSVASLQASTITEGQSVSYSGVASDPGSDDLTFSWSWGFRSVCDTTVTYLNDPLVGPDPFPSPTVNPRSVTESRTCQYGDNGAFTVTLTVTDDDGLSTTVTTTVMVDNVAPFVVSLPSVTINEGQTVSFTGQATDPGSDDLTFAWGWDYRSVCDTSTTHLNDPIVGPDPYPSPTVNPRSVTESRSCQYGDNGVFTVTLTVSDDDGLSTTVSTTVTVLNLAPTVDSLPAVTMDEAQTASFSGHATDPGSDDLTFAWTWDYRSVCDTSTLHLNDPIVGTDPLPSPTVNPRDITETMSCQYGDDGAFTVTLTVSDDDGLSTTVTTTVTVDNVDPTIDPTVRVYVLVDVTLRAAGEKYHDVGLTLYEGRAVTSTSSVTRYPGSPDVQAITTSAVPMDILACSSSATVEYTPWNDPINGQIFGATPVWVILTFEDGLEVWLNHTFNVNHPSTWVWTISDFCPYINAVGLPIYFEATASDVGSDDLTFKWSWGDSTPDVSTTYYNNGVSADPYPSPDVNPITQANTVTHTYTTSGTYTITLKVDDDDGGQATRTISLTI